MTKRRQIRVVIADDHLQVRAAIRKYLERASDLLVVGEAGNGKEAVELVEALDPDILILDLEMPVIGGVEVLEMLQRKGYNVPVLILSANEKLFYTSVLEDMGASGYVMKGEAPELMLSMVREHARSHR